MRVPAPGRAIATDRPAQSASAAEIDNDRDARIHPRRNGERSFDQGIASPAMGNSAVGRRGRSKKRPDNRVFRARGSSAVYRYRRRCTHGAPIFVTPALPAFAANAVGPREFVREFAREFGRVRPPLPAAIPARSVPRERALACAATAPKAALARPSGAFANCSTCFCFMRV